MTVVACQDVARTYGRGHKAVVAVHGISCGLGRGDHVALTGPSGSGKTTLLHLLAGLDRPTTGTIAWPDLDDEPRGHVGVVFQGPSLLPPLDAAENVALPLLIAGQPAADARLRALAALDAVGVGDLAAKLPQELSGGQAQRVAVARVLAGSPQLIIADEPTAQLDAPLAVRVVELLVTVAEELHAALVIATHDARIAQLLPVHWRMRDGGLTC
ncbi:ABC transporter ATP-binding protein [Acrocarpospora catenulata]|uniref:ABC transporter ATP-binding protein n=1 Tax=Acrocarpospora catenulata TaxID=2836182 RepID=UPI001BDAD70A|nr:ABC transporter ATP-binding protein [Acrocarpospora catenulata]